MLGATGLGHFSRPASPGAPELAGMGGCSRTPLRPRCPHPPAASEDLGDAPRGLPGNTQMSPAPRPSLPAASRQRTHEIVSTKSLQGPERYKTMRTHQASKPPEDPPLIGEGKTSTELGGGSEASEGSIEREGRGGEGAARRDVGERSGRNTAVETGEYRPGGESLGGRSDGGVSFFMRSF